MLQHFHTFYVSDLDPLFLVLNKDQNTVNRNVTEVKKT